MIKVKVTIGSLCLAALLISLLANNGAVSYVLMGICFAVSLVLLWRNMSALADVSKDSPKTTTLKIVSVFTVVMCAVAVAVVVLGKNGILILSGTAEKYFEAAIVLAIILFIGNMAPKLPFNRYVGLRLPWTVRDEETWIVAHRILAYIAFPIAIIYLIGIPTINDFAVLSAGTLIAFVAIPSVVSLLYFYRKFHVTE
jgi:uncharacterized membrane protein